MNEWYIIGHKRNWFSGRFVYRGGTKFGKYKKQRGETCLFNKTDRRRE